MGIKDITIRLGGDAAGLSAAFKQATRDAGQFKGSIESFASQYKATMAAAFDKGAAERMAQNLYGTMEGMKSRMLAQAKQLKGIFSDAQIVGSQGKFRSAGADEFKSREGASASVNLAAATGMNVDKVSAMMAKSLLGVKTELQKIVPEIANMTKEELKAGAAIELVAKKYAGFGDAANAALKKAEFTAHMKDVGDQMKNVGQSMSMYVTAPLVAGAGASVHYASDVNESMNKVDVAFGKSGALVKAFADTSLAKFGMSKGSALDMAAGFGDMATSMGLNTNQAAKMAVTLAGLAGDMSSFKNIGIDISQTALQSIFTGETESLKKLGVVMTEANLNAYALSKGITTKVQAMNESEKVMLRYEYILAKTKNSQGDFARTAEGAANQQRTLTEGLKQMGSSFGAVILPVWEKFLKLINGVVAWMSQLSTVAKTIIVVLAAIAAGIGPILIGVGVFISTVMPALIAGGAAIATAWAPVTAVVLALAAAFAIFSFASEKAQEQVDKMANTKYFKPLKAEYDLNKNKIKELERQQSGGGLNNRNDVAAGSAFSAVRTADTFTGNEGEINRLKERNALISKAIDLKKKQVEQENDAKQKAKEMADALKASMEATNSGTEKVTGLIGLQQQKVTLLTKAWTEAKSEGQIAKLAKELKLANTELERLKNLGVEINKSLHDGLNTTEIASKFGADSVGKITPTKHAAGLNKDGTGGNVKLGTYITEAKEGIKEMQTLMESFVAGVKDAIASTLEGIGTMFGKLASGNGKGALKSFLMGFVSTVADFAINMGKMLVGIGLGLEAFYESLSAGPIGGAIALAAGAALIIAGAAFKSFVSAGPSGGGGSSSHATVGRTTAQGSAATASPAAGKVNVVGELKMQMGELKAALKTINKQSTYTNG